MLNGEIVVKMWFFIAHAQSLFQDCFVYTGSRSAVGNVYDYRCVSDWRCRGPEFDPCPVPYFRIDHEIISMYILLPSTDSFKKGCCE